MIVIYLMYIKFKFISKGQREKVIFDSGWNTKEDVKKKERDCYEPYIYVYVWKHLPRLLKTSIQGI
jgi:hypothetical protein